MTADLPPPRIPTVFVHQDGEWQQLPLTSYAGRVTVTDDAVWIIHDDGVLRKWSVSGEQGEFAVSLAAPPQEVPPPGHELLHGAYQAWCDDCGDLAETPIT